MNSVSIIDIVILISLVGGITYAGHLLGGTISDREGFFQAGGSLPWWAVSSSIIATVLSSVTFISIPAAVFKNGGNLGYLQLLLGLMFGKLLIGLVFAKPYYETEANTTYDYIAQKVDVPVARISLVIGLIMSTVLASIKVLTTGLVLSVLTGWTMLSCVTIVICFAILWSWMAGLKTVIWTDFLLFGLFTLGALFTILWMMISVDMPMAEAMLYLDGQAKTAIFDFSVDPKIRFTIWSGIIGGALMSLAAASSQGTMQRVKACRSANDARKAYLFAAFFYVTSICMLIAGLGLSVFYFENPLPADVIAQLEVAPDRIFPYYIVNEIPAGVSSLFIAAIFAAGISTIDTSLTEAADISVTNIYSRYIKLNASEGHYLIASRLSLIIWGFLYVILAYYFSRFSAEGLLNLNFRLPNYLLGSILGTILIARLGFGTWHSCVIGLVASLAAVLQLEQLGVSFLWWCPAAAVVMFMTTYILNALFEKFGLLSDTHNTRGLK